MNKSKEDDFECERPEWLEDVTRLLLDEFENGNIPMEPIGPAILDLSLLEIDPCPRPAVSYFKDDVMFTWSSPNGTMSLVAGSKLGVFLVWFSRNGYGSKKWENATVAEVRKMFVGLFATINVRWNPKP